MFRTLANSFMNRVYWGGDGFGGGGADAGLGDDDFGTIPDSDADDDGADDDQSGRRRESPPDDEITGDASSFMSQLFEAGDETDDDDYKLESPEELVEAEKQMSQDLKNGLNGLTLPEDIIPDDFDASDPKQLRDLLNRVQINTATQAIRLMFRPVQETLNRMSNRMRYEMRETSRSGHEAVSEQQAIREEFPGIMNPEIGPAIKMAIDASKKKHPNDRKAAFSAAKKALGIMGIKGWDTAPVGRRRGGDSEGSGFRSGEDALDGLGLRLPTQSPRRTTGDRLRR